MSRLGIVSCQVLENELAHLLNSRNDIDVVCLRRTGENRLFSELLNVRIRFVNDICHTKINTSLSEVYVDILPAALHTDLDELEYTCHESINDMKEYCGSILLFFGLCGNALKSVFSRDDTRIIRINDEYGELVDDCFVATLGRDLYMEHLRNLGSFFVTMGWVEHWKSIIRKLDDPKREGAFRNMIHLNDYKRVLYIDQDSIGNEGTISGAKGISAELGLDYRYSKGRMDLLAQALDRAIASSRQRKVFKPKKNTYGHPI